MAYVKTNWVNDVTPINAANLNKIENAIKATYYENGSSGNWTWKKYDDGTFDAWYAANHSIACTTPSAPFGGYRTGQTVNVAIPTALQGFNFEAILCSKQGDGSVIPNGYQRNGNNLIGYWQSGESITTTRRLAIYCHGRWS